MNSLGDVVGINTFLVNWNSFIYPLILTSSVLGVTGKLEKEGRVVHIIVQRDRLFQAVAELRAIGGSGVVVTPVTYIFEEEPERIRAMMKMIEEAGSKTQENTGAEK